MRFLPLTGDRCYRANPCTGCASDAIFCNDKIFHKIAAFAGWTFLYSYMRFIFFPEIIEGRQHRVWRTLAQTA
jgi:hypothetical protein